MDVHTPDQRSRNMGRIRGRDPARSRRSFCAAGFTRRECAFGCRPAICPEPLI